MNTRLNTLLTAGLAAALLAGCGGGGDGGSSEPPPPPVTNKFTQTATWTFTLPAAGGEICYDFDRRIQDAQCTGNQWDLKLASAGRSATFWTNSGVSGSGAGGAFGSPFDRDWTTLSTWQDATVDPVDGPMPAAVYFADSAKTVFSGSNEIGVAAFEYSLNNDHQLYPNYRVFLITTDSSSADPVGTAMAPVFALQITGYYGGASGTTSGYPSLRWVDRAAPAIVRTATVNASAGWVYFNLITGTTVEETGTWHIAFNRYNVKLNGGKSGSGTVAGFLGKTPAGFYDAEGKPITAKFLAAGNPAATLPDLTAADIAVPAAASNWVKDDITSTLNAPYVGTYPNTLDYGWYRYHPTVAAAAAAGLQPAVAHLLSANPAGASLLRSGEGNSYARFHVTSITYGDPSNASSAQTWTIQFDVQPAAQ
ncbi:MAG: HmuY family protein [Burkholderiaceae bacterium]